MENNVHTTICCPVCQSSDIQFQLVNKQYLVPKRHGFVWWLFLGWWWVPIKWIFLYSFLWLLIIPLKMLLPKRTKLDNVVENYKICRRCGNHWK